MKRIWIAGSSGSGKTTLARLLGEKYDICVYHRDLITWNDQGNERLEEEQIELTRRLTQQQNWIFEGCRFTASKTDGRLDRCDTIIFLKINRFICLYRVLKRYYRQLRQKIPKSKLQEINFKIISYVLLDFPRKARERTDLFALAGRAGKEVILLNGRKAVREFLKRHSLT